MFFFRCLLTENSPVIDGGSVIEGSENEIMKFSPFFFNQNKIGIAHLF